VKLSLPLFFQFSLDCLSSHCLNGERRTTNAGARRTLDDRELLKPAFRAAAAPGLASSDLAEDARSFARLAR
jgi:hypothetical protein